MSLTTADVKRRVDDALGLIASRADDIERDRRLPDDVVAALRRSGMNRPGMPAALGGSDAPVLDVVDVIERIAAVDASTGLVRRDRRGSNVFAGHVGEAAARTVFRDPDQGNATMFGPYGQVTRDGGGHRLTGRWPFARNCLHSAWIGLGAFVRTDDGEVDPVPRVCFLPIVEVTIEDTWDALGQRGTGSHQVSATDVEVDLARSCTFADRPWREGTLWRLPLYAALLPGPAAVPLGIARGVLDEVARQPARAGPPAGGSSRTTRLPWPTWPPPTPAWGRPGPACGPSSPRPRPGRARRADRPAPAGAHLPGLPARLRRRRRGHRRGPRAGRRGGRLRHEPPATGAARRPDRPPAPPVLPQAAQRAGQGGGGHGRRLPALRHVTPAAGLGAARSAS